eukprot:403342957
MVNLATSNPISDISLEQTFIKYTQNLIVCLEDVLDDQKSQQFMLWMLKG